MTRKILSPAPVVVLDISGDGVAGQAFEGRLYGAHKVKANCNWSIDTFLSNPIFKPWA
jgi:hypothetical protein